MRKPCCGWYVIHAPDCPERDREEREQEDRRRREQEEAWEQFERERAAWHRKPDRTDD